jgi:hypothetical protein
VRLLILLGVLLAFNLTFELIDETAPARDWWLFDDNEYKLTPEWYWHEVQRRVTVAISFFLLAYYVNHDRKEVQLFALLQVFDFADWLVTNSTTWFHIGAVPISSNMIIPTIFVMVILQKIWRTTTLN